MSTLQKKDIVKEAANVIEAIESTKAANPKLSELFQKAGTASEISRMEHLRETYNVTRSATDDEIIALAEIETCLMSRAIGEFEARAFSSEGSRTEEISKGFAANNAPKLAMIHKPI
jgi:hypothetical protein